MMKTVPLIYRVFLIGLLPLIALLLYSKGQKYDPALIDFRAAAVGEPSAPTAVTQTVKEAGNFGPGKKIEAIQKIPGFRQNRQRQFTRENLYEHVNGHAEYFISAGFLGLTVTDYVAEGTNVKNTEISAEVYDMGKSIQAFGVLVDESGENPSPVSIGSMGFKTSAGVNFIQDRYYVKISAFDPKAPTLKFAKSFSETLPAGQASFQIFSRLPDLGKVVTTRFIKEGYRGLDFVRNVVEREYSAGDKKLFVALMTGSDKDMRLLKTAFLEYFRKSGIINNKLEGNKNEVYKVLDKYEGAWFLVLTPEAVYCVFGTEDAEILKHFTKTKG